VGIRRRERLTSIVWPLEGCCLVTLTGGSWQYIETDWGPLDVTDEEFGGDWLVSKWIGEQLTKPHDKPFFLACGIYRPHEPWFVPKKYFDQFPLDEIQLPPGYKKDDLADLPAASKKTSKPYFQHIQKQNQWRQGVQGYLASIAFADAMVGRVMDALEKSPHRDNTIVVLWSDHGWHLGEKEKWQKYTGWRVCTRVPLIVSVPPGVAALPWPHAAITHMDRPENYSVSGPRFRYIHYADGGEELYDIQADRYEWNNLAGKLEFAEPLARLKAKAPKEFATFVPAKMRTLVELKWNPVGNGVEMPKSNPNGDQFDIFFNNKSKQPVDIFRVDVAGQRHAYGTLERGWFKPYQTRAGELWLVTTKQGKLLGHFVVGDEEAQAMILD